ncbi:MAG: T9SS type A sorting domain-containing protein, partial [Flavobacteriales bacterium]|nr:T9SS type A sorting domain-containing protein [Flavobacteriales bacterium]
CPYAFNASCPSNALPLNSIFGVYHDIDPSVCGGASYALLGTAPCRTFVVNYNDVCHFSCNTMISACQIVLYETTNAIEVYVENKPTCTGWNSGNALIGIQDATGTTGLAATDRNTGPWTASNEAWRFTANGGPNFEVEWFNQGGSLGTGTTISICPSEPTETLIARATYTRCDGTIIQVEDNVQIVCSAIVLPVEWLDFDAKLIEGDSKTRCTWSTATEINNDYFTVQRTVDGNYWEDIGTVAGAGTTQQQQDYEFIDPNPLYGVSYYRIKQTDYNGEFDYSQKRAVERAHRLQITAFPNPSDGRYQLNGLGDGSYVIVYDSRGALIQSILTASNELILTDPAKGCYIAEVRNEYSDKVKRIRLVVR